MTRRRALDDPEIAATAWARFRRLLAWMALAGLLCVGLALLLLRLWTGPMPIHMIIATAAGVWFTFMMGTALMGLVFLSHGTGHDDEVIDRLKEELHDQ
ncbi:MAG: hypothetical protein ABW039_05560 [Sphingobium sp.]